LKIGGATGVPKDSHTFFFAIWFRARTQISWIV